MPELYHRVATLVIVVELVSCVGYVWWITRRTI